MPEEQYLEALLCDLAQELSRSGGRKIHSIFFGGGTPSLISPAIIAELLRVLRDGKHLTAKPEITLEANPGAADQSRFSGYVEAGVNRLSIGAQSFQDSQLKKLGRIHNASAILKAFNAARQAGFANINLDLMFGLPEQSTASALQDLEQAIALQPEHISWYQLTLEPNTPFFHRPPPLPSDENRWRMQVSGKKSLAKAGFKQYEVSAYAQPGRQCRHNLNYWRFGDYLGIGAGAHGKLTQGDKTILRSHKPRLPNHYMQSMKAAESGVTDETISNPAEQRFEYLMNALRLNAGFSLNAYRQRTNDDLASLKQSLKQPIENHLIKEQSARLMATSRGHRYLDSILTDQLP